mmetsp:Transcript_46557/g.74597  ORF Transcript_46557/g.74597 Transcript_46557/m.74597 type:complete len:227 (+) Transcript_46557:154-834(+)
MSQATQSKYESNGKRECDHLFKIVIVGDSGVGKSCLLLRFADDMWSNNYIATIGVDFRFKTLRVDEQSVQLQIWDTAGHERFRAINASYFRGCDGAVICYDVCRRETYKNVLHHLQQIQEKGEKNAAKILVATKCDAESAREVSFDEGVELSQQLHLAFFEISAKLDKHVNDAFVELAKQCILHKQLEQHRKSQQQKELAELSSNQSSKVSLCDISHSMKHSGCSC